MEGLRFPNSSPQKKNHKPVMIIAVLAILSAIGILFYFYNHFAVVSNLVTEAGLPLPTLNDFIIDGKIIGNSISGLPQDTTIPGIYDIMITTENKSYYSKLTVEDTIPPVGHADPVRTWLDAKVQPADFVRDVFDATAVTFSFFTEPSTAHIGIQPVSVLLTDAGGNTITLFTKLHVYDTLDKLTVKAGTDLSRLCALDFITGASPEEAEFFTLLSDFGAIDSSLPGKREVILALNNVIRRSFIDIPDTTPPAASPLFVQKFTGDGLTAEEFVCDIIDETPVTVSFLAVPDNMLPGEQIIEILLTDAYGNETPLTSKLTLIPDTEPPTIEGSLDKTVFVGDTIAYRAGITVTDNRDSEVPLIIDSSEVNAKTAGKYPVTYSATDKAGNTAVAQGTITVLSVSREQVYEMADNVLAKIIKADKSLYDQAQAIHTWVKSNIGYIASAPLADPILAAYRGLKDHNGDCYVFASVAELLLTRSDIDNIMIHRIEGTRTRHYWALVNTGEGWYHFDTTPHLNGGICFMLTETQVQNLAKRRGKDYYTYDKSLYPQAVE